LHSIFERKWADVLKENPTFGTAPNKARAEQASVRKFIAAIHNGDITPHTNVEHLCICVMFILGFCCGLHGLKEHIELSTNNICTGDHQDEDGEELACQKFAFHSPRWVN